MKKKNVVILGSTGSVGSNAVKAVLEHRDLFNVIGLVARNNVDCLAAQARQLNCPTLITTAGDKRAELGALAPVGSKILSGPEAVRELVRREEVDSVLCAIIGTGGLLPVIDALLAGKTVALASKEVMVMAGDLVTAAAREGGGQLIPVDSEHSAIFQCLRGHPMNEVSKIILTSSGGAFRDYPAAEIAAATYEDALVHPTWEMGAKITIDSASMMNKALEIIEAGYLFGLPAEKIEVVIHREAIIHSLVEFIDGCVLAQMSEPDMGFPIRYALFYPERRANRMKPLNLAECGRLTFAAPDRKKFPSLDFAYQALREGGTLPAVMNAANEAAVEKFRAGKIAFPRIWAIISKVMALHRPEPQTDIATVLRADAWARAAAEEVADENTEY
ncbi:MAG: 1-deoxy-D-xylulose-5-phosphate reductoisomerase [Victivallaceae bacterium]|nr:1-deoxy-D-xylulose-5-phosphate reductoisomerase [Victivallaceae bacterium]